MRDSFVYSFLSLPFVVVKQNNNIPNKLGKQAQQNTIAKQNKQWAKQAPPLTTNQNHKQSLLIDKVGCSREVSTEKAVIARLTKPEFQVAVLAIQEENDFAKEAASHHKIYKQLLSEKFQTLADFYKKMSAVLFSCDDLVVLAKLPKLIKSKGRIPNEFEGIITSQFQLKSLLQSTPRLFVKKTFE